MFQPIQIPTLVLNTTFLFDVGSVAIELAVLEIAVIGIAGFHN
jgi:hypothetical protein